MLGRVHLVKLKQTEDDRQTTDGSILIAHTSILEIPEGKRIQLVDFRISEEDEDPIFSLPLHVPRGYELTTENWFYLFEHSRGNNSAVKLSRRMTELSGGVQLVRSWGASSMEYFEITIDDDVRYAILVEREETNLLDFGLIPRITPFIVPEGEKILVQYSTDRIYLEAMENDVLVGEYGLDFTDPFDPAQVLHIFATERRNFEIRPEMTNNETVEVTEETPPYLHWKVFGYFHYLETSDGKYAFATQKNAAFKAMEACLTRIEEMSDWEVRAGAQEWFNDGLMTFLRNDSAHIDLLCHCVEFLNKETF